MDTFYKIVTNSETEIGRIFQEFGKNVSVKNWMEIQSEFHAAIEKNFPSIRCEINAEIAEEQNPIPDRLLKRIKVVSLLLGVLVSGGTYSKKLYINTVAFCASLDSNKHDLTQNYSS